METASVSAATSSDDIGRASWREATKRLESSSSLVPNFRSGAALAFCWESASLDFSRFALCSGGNEGLRKGQYKPLEIQQALAVNLEKFRLELGQDPSGSIQQLGLRSAETTACGRLAPNGHIFVIPYIANGFPRLQLRYPMCSLLRRWNFAFRSSA